MTNKQFIEAIAKYVIKYAPKYGICVYSPIIAQACLESAYGTSKKAKYHNYFGLKYRKNRVKCNSGYFEDGGSEQEGDGTYTKLPSDTAWYSFANMEKGVEGYFQFINISNYKNLKGVTDPKTYLENIKKDGYATSLKYVENVYKVITEWNLTKYDILKEEVNNMSFKVAIDSGHGSNTAGKRSPDGYREHYSNTYIAFYLDQILTKNGISTFKSSWDDSTVTDDADVSLTTRQKNIKAAKCDIVVSIHANAYGDGKSYNSANGIVTFHHATESSSKDSKKLATLIQAELVKGSSQTNRGVKSAKFAMCNCSVMGVKAAVLIETAFMTNKKEAELLKSDAYMRECAKEIAQGIFNYLGVPGNVNVPLASATGKATTTSTNTTKSNIVNTTTSSTKKFTHNGLDYSLVFNPTYYVNRYIDLKKNIGNNETVLFNHFINYGINEGRQAITTFNVSAYKSKNPDLQIAFGNNLKLYVEHYINFGHKENRKFV